MRTIRKPARLLAAVLVVLAGVTAQGCRESEQGRILSYEKGKYLGKPDQQLSAARREQLRQRARMAQQY